MKPFSTFQLILRQTLPIIMLVGVCFTHVLANGSAKNKPARTITGNVTIGTNNQSIAGANIVIKGTQIGTITDQRGNYSITVNADNAVLVYSFIGYKTQEVVVGNKSIIDVALVENNEVLGEVVVTALGIKREARSLGYSVGEVQGKDLSRVAQENVLNSLAGRVAGVQISSTGPSGSSVSMIIRGAKSLNTDNQPLFVVDGVPVANSLNNVSQIGNDNRVDYGNAISDINPDDVENISILKGPSAAALYGSRAGNGVVLITTKSGSKSQKMTVSVTSNTVFDQPYKYLKMGSKFATGILPFTPDNNPYPGGILQIDESSSGGVGPELDKGYNAIQWNSPVGSDGNQIPTPLVSHPNNVRDFVRTGITSTNGVSISNNSEKITYRLSYSNMSSRGIVPNSDLFKNTLAISTNVRVNSKLTLSTNLDFSRNNSNNRPAGERGTNPLQWAYGVGSHIDINDLRNYWVPGKEGLQQQSQSIGNYNNPWFLAYEVNNGYVRDRVFGNLKAEWQITPEIKLMGRYALDTYSEQRETKIAKSYTGEPNGAYGLINLKRYERNADFLATYTKRFNALSVVVSAGGNNRYSQSTDLSNSSKSGAGLIIPGLYTIQNIAPNNLQYSNYLYKKAIYSAYATANLGYKDMIYLDLTARNDWSSTLPVNNRSYFYPSASLSLLLNEIVHLSNNVDMFKLRAGVAQVGNDANPYSLYPTLGDAGAWNGVTRLSKSGSILLPNLKPEIATSYEVGIDYNMFRNRLRFSGTYYMSDNRNQILPSQISPSSGFTTKNINAGLLESRGIELSLGGTLVDKGGLRWDLTTNFTKNTTRIKELAEGIPYYTLWTDAKGGAWTYVGDKVGDIYDAEVITVTDQKSSYYGYPILDNDGSWQSKSATNTKNKIGNFNPNFMLGAQSSLSYKGFTLNFSLDWRAGGDFVSQTYRYMESDLRSQRFLDNLINPGDRTGDALRNWLVENADKNIKIQGNYFPIVGGPTAAYGGYPFEFGGKTYAYGVFNPGVIAQYDSQGNITGYTENLGGAGTKIIPYGDNYPWSFTRAATFDASFVKLREVSLGYELPAQFVKSIGLQSATFSVYSRNIILWTAAKINVDPEMAFQPQSSPQAGTQFKQGIERYNVTPWTIPVGFKLGLTF
ncbi:SusC/RagA family TonB-linked outer membrane protein [Spirosoma pollinicola]|uniref:SusC/RagA family TonB-linked outer membrane protein n=1 Tax=Spirosoma pollinicola TaxID=2057025 RepID=A0A2K8Z5A4_9BACT|nr:SusC/RagA family TonB-linked outer membrane protein [Spirosoma pollinicola]AUD04999.1 SusC/RagA family TonB-linked outer membrane protein [Spirosoma pollinicola]